MTTCLDQNRILDAARVAFARHGFRKTTLADIVHPLGVTKTAVYHHFPGGKEEIFHALIVREEGFILADMESAVAAVKDPPARLRSLIMAKLTHFQRLRELLMVPRDVGEEVAQLYARHETSFRTSERDMIAAILRQGQVEGCFRPIETEQLARNVQTILNRLELPLIFENGPEKMEQEVDDLLYILFHGIMTGKGENVFPQDNPR
ncbi:MAG TPA: TetR family transcriptional regulator [Syntrophales bacterium]|jgi:AcrR family transcriptional regulator|nr:TetR family transcriptional regulator [Syntrophales bacterium]HON22573.1 TetR family transcriptional regulator [Syntrophales bacterium]HOU77192.1 TetR family transcriptional regulator [Syntrophales bacterium]HPC32043.1 TetR family transcriptional regulator [Syntrophales bacterium]HQG33790.1 TetR family transcriptional regulator [Syntrophales bacterium]